MATLADFIAAAAPDICLTASKIVHLSHINLFCTIMIARIVQFSGGRLDNGRNSTQYQ
jgi:hypothetical protein